MIFDSFLIRFNNKQILEETDDRFKKIWIHTPS